MVVYYIVFHALNMVFSTILNTTQEKSNKIKNIHFKNTNLKFKMKNFFKVKKQTDNKKNYLKKPGNEYSSRNNKIFIKDQKTPTKSLQTFEDINTKREEIDINEELNIQNELLNKFRENFSQQNKTEDLVNLSGGKCLADNYINFFSINVDLCLTKIKENIEEFTDSIEFKFIFEILQNDLSNILKGFKYFSKETGLIDDLIFKASIKHSFNTEIYNFLEIIRSLFKCNFLIISSLNSSNLNTFNSLLITKYRKSSKTKNFRHLIYRKLLLFKKNKQITMYDIFYYTLYLINNTNDTNFKTIFLYGIQNLFVCDTENFNPHFYYVLVFLYIFNHEKYYYEFDFYGKFLKLMTANNKITSRKYFYENILRQIFKKDRNVYFRLYLSINSININYALRCYRKIQCNDIQLLIINNLIELLNIVKIKIYGLN